MANFLNRIPNKLTKTITFNGGANAGAIGSVPVFEVTGMVLLQVLAIRCLTSLAGASATIALGTAGNTGGLIAATTATDIDAGLIWKDATPDTGVVAAGLVDYLAALDIIATIAVANVDAGALEVTAYWLPVSADGQLA